MKKLLILAGLIVAIATTAGCNSCRQRGGLFGGLFNRGDRCDDCPPADCMPGIPRATMMYPSTPQIMPGPIEIAPMN